MSGPRAAVGFPWLSHRTVAEIDAAIATGEQVAPEWRAYDRKLRDLGYTGVQRRAMIAELVASDQAKVA